MGAGIGSIRQSCGNLVRKSWFDHSILFFIGLNCVTLAMERPLIPPDSFERAFLSLSNYVFTFVFAIEMMLKVLAVGMFYGSNAYFDSGWNIMDGLLVTVSIVDILMSLLSSGSPRIFGILRVRRQFQLTVFKNTIQWRNFVISLRSSGCCDP